MDVEVDQAFALASRVGRNGLVESAPPPSPVELNRSTTPVSPGPLPDMPGMEINFRNTFLEISPRLGISMPRPSTMPNLNELLEAGSENPTYIEDLDFELQWDGCGILDEAHTEVEVYGSPVYDPPFGTGHETLLGNTAGSSVGPTVNSDAITNFGATGSLTINNLQANLSSVIDHAVYSGSYSPSSRQQYKATRKVRETPPEGLSPEMLTTVMLRNIPNKLSQMDIANAVKHEGFLGQFDFFYSPLDFKSGSNLGYAFINFITHEAAVSFQLKIAGVLLARSVAEANSSGLHWDNSTGSKATVITPEVHAQLMRSSKQCGVAWARIQGLEANIKHYRNSPVNELTAEFRPMLFATSNLVMDHPTIPVGTLLPFPRPDRQLPAHNPGMFNVNKGAHPFIPQQQAQLQKKQSYSNTPRGHKIFVGGLSSETTSEILEDYFTTTFPMFNLVEAVVIVDRRSQLSKGFGFATFATADAVNHILHPANNPHIIDGHPVALRSYTSHR